MRFILITLISLVFVVTAQGDKTATAASAVDKAASAATTAAATATAAADAAAASVKAAVDAAKAAAANTIPVSGSGAEATKDEFNNVGNDTVTLKGSFNGTDTTDQGFTYNYKQGGDDWASLVSKYGVENHCGDAANQSPVNLLQPIWSYGWAYGDTIPKAGDAHETTYKNLRKGVKV